MRKNFKKLCDKYLELWDEYIQCMFNGSLWSS